MSIFTSPHVSKQAIPTDPVALWHQTRRLMYSVAKKVKLAVRLKLEGGGRAEAA